MTQMGFFDVENRYTSLDANNAPWSRAMPSFLWKHSAAVWKTSGASRSTSVSPATLRHAVFVLQNPHFRVNVGLR